MTARLYVYAQTIEQAALTRWKALEAIDNGHPNIGLSVLQTLTLCSFSTVAQRAARDLARLGMVEEIGGAA